MPTTALQQASLLSMLNQAPDNSKPVGLSLFADFGKSFHHKAQDLKNTSIPKRVLQTKTIIGTNRESNKSSTQSKKLNPKQIKFIETSGKSDVDVFKRLLSEDTMP